MLIPVNLSFNEHPESTVSVEGLVNMQPEFTNGGRQPVILRSCPGMLAFSSGNPNATEGRGLIVCGGILYAVLGKYLYRIASDGTATQFDRIDGSGPVGMSENGELIHIAIGEKEYLFDTVAETITVPTKAAYGYTTAYLNGRFQSEDPDATDQGRFYYSDLAGTTWSDIDFATAEQKTDDAIAVFAFKGMLLVCGSGSIEFWQSDASGPVAVPGAFTDVGLASRRAIAAADNMFGFLASDGSFRIGQGYNTQRVSTPAVEAALNTDADAECFAYVEEGHTMFEVSTSTITLAYDATASQQLGKQVWIERQSDGGRHHARGVARCYGKLLTLSTANGMVYELTRSAYPDVREFTLPYLADDANRQWSVLNELELVQRTGTGAIAHGTSQVMMRASRDGGKSWGEERWADEGTVGQYGSRVRWRRFGRFRSLAVRFRKTDQTEWTVLGVNARGS